MVICMENHHFWWEHSRFQWPFSSSQTVTSSLPFRVDGTILESAIQGSHVGLPATKVGCNHQTLGFFFGCHWWIDATGVFFHGSIYGHLIGKSISNTCFFWYTHTSSAYLKINMYVLCENSMCMYIHACVYIHRMILYYYYYYCLLSSQQLWSLPLDCMPWPFFNVVFFGSVAKWPEAFCLLGLINPLDVANGGVWEVIPSRLQTSGCGQDRRFFLRFSMRMIQMEFRVQNLSGFKHSGYTSRRCTASGRREHFRAWSDASSVIIP